MTGRSWQFVVHDARGRAHRGSVLYASRAPGAVPLPEGDAFRVVLLDQPRRLRSVGERTAICIPAALAVHAVGDQAPLHLPDEVDAWTLPPHRMAAYASGSIFTAAPLAIAAEDVFPVHADRPRLDRLALALLEAGASEDFAAYTALVRHELALPAGADPVFELEERLAPPGRRDRPPKKAPGVARLGAALAALRDHRAPDISLEQFADDLRLLRLFARDDRWPSAAMERLLGDVQPGSARRTGKRASAARIVPLRGSGEDS